MSAQKFKILVSMKWLLDLVRRLDTIYCELKQLVSKIEIDLGDSPASDNLQENQGIEEKFLKILC